MDNQQELKITSEQDAFSLIKKALQNEIGDDVKFVFDNWPKLTIELEGTGYEAALTPSIMQSLVDFQTGLNRTYVKIIHDENNLLHLKAEEKKSIEFKASVENGCTLINVDLTEFAQRITTELVTKMQPTHIIVLAISGMLLWVGGSIIKKHLELASHDKDVSEEAKKAVAMSDQETKRMEIMADAFKAQPKLNYVNSEVSSAMIGLLKGISDADSIEIQGVKFSNSDARVIAQTKRSESIDVQLNGNYQILSVDTSIDDEVKIRLLQTDTQREFTAKFKDHTLDGAQIALLKDAEWSRPKKNVYLSINATELRGNITTATIISVTSQPS